MKMKLYEITIVAYKTFYVEAATQSDALKHDAVLDESRGSGDFDWEHEETTAVEINADQAKFIKRSNPEQIAESYD